MLTVLVNLLGSAWASWWPARSRPAG
jgi:hypothetical protein